MTPGADGVRRATRLLKATMESLTPAATDDEHRILDHIIDGQTDSQVVESFGTDSPRIAADATALVESLTRALLGEGTPPGEPVADRHRRHD